MCIGLFGRALLVLMSGIGIAAGLAGSGVAAAPPSSTNPSTTTLVIRGDSETTVPSVPSSGEDNSPVVLRGSPPSPPQPPAPTCSAGYVYEAGYGCVAPSYAYEPYDYGYDYDYWPYWGFDGLQSGSRRRSFPHRFIHRAGRGPAARVAFGHGVAHSGGLRLR